MIMPTIVVFAKTVSAKGFRYLQIGMGLFLPFPSVLLERIWSHWEGLWRGLWRLQKDLTAEVTWNVSGTQRHTPFHFLPYCQILRLSTGSLLTPCLGPAYLRQNILAFYWAKGGELMFESEGKRSTAFLLPIIPPGLVWKVFTSTLLYCSTGCSYSKA